MRRRTIRALVCIAAALPLIAAESDCSSEVKDSADSGGGGDGKPKKASLGDPITLESTDVKMRVRTTKTIDPLAGGEFDKPDAGRRYVGVQVELVNVGKTAYDDSPSNGAKLLTATDEQAESTILLAGSCAGDFGSSAKIAPGSRQQGCLPFQVPSAARLKTFQFGLDSGFGPQTGEWRLR